MPKPSKAPIAYTVCQHSGFAFNEDPAFQKGLQLAMVTHATAQERILNVGGMLFSEWKDCDTFENEAAYPEKGYPGLLPQARGTFSKKKFEGLPIYLPDVKDFEICQRLGIKFRCKSYVVGSLSTPPTKTESVS